MSDSSVSNAAQRHTLLRGRVAVWQPASGALRAGLDAVMVAAACPARAGERVVDLGCGAGAAGLCVAARVPGALAFGVERAPPLAALAARGGLPVVCADVRGFHVARPFDHAVCNPPFHDAGAHLPSPAPQRAGAMGAQDGDARLDDWVRCAARVVRPGGTLSLIHRADALPAVLAALGGRFGAARVIPLWPRAGAEARRVVVVARKGARGPMVLAPGVVLHEAGGAWTAAARAVLEDAAGLVVQAHV
jgi:tRNA1(Val) A37 N6-methylase TrmN6